MASGTTAPARNALLAKLRSAVGVRLTRFAGVAVASLATSEVTLTLCDSVFHLTATPSAVTSWFTGAVVSYVLSRWAWERKGKPDLLRETVPFWLISLIVVVILTLSTKLGYRSAAWLHLRGAEHTAWVDLVYLAANFITFVTRFVIFHYVLFSDRRGKKGAAAPDAESVEPQESATR
ncbi:MAG TPA: GtrA family protein [Trebonia sp.]|jgi:putative flippase GtrA|nr:GtrA family protein [Trebonia sp.]